MNAVSTRPAPALDLNEEIDLERAAEISGLAVNTIRSYVSAGRIPSSTRPRVLRRPNQATSQRVGTSFARQHFVTYGALLQHFLKRDSRPQDAKPIKPKPLPDIFFETYGDLAEPLRQKRPTLDPLHAEIREAMRLVRKGEDILVPVDEDGRRPTAVRARVRAEAERLGLRVRMEDEGIREHLNRNQTLVREPIAIRVRPQRAPEPAR